MNLSLDKETILEFSSQHKDYIFIAILVIILLAGGWFLYQQSAQSVEEIIQENLAAQAGGPGQNQGTDIVSTETIVNQLLSKRPRSSYEVKRSPFGSPEEQLRMKQQVEAAYQKGRELFEQGEYKNAIQQFDRVISLDVTETRISYDILPSEYKRRAQQAYAKNNLEKILQEAQSKINEGDRLVQSGSNKEAIEAYTSANEQLTEVINSDPEGKEIGPDNLKKVKNLQQTAYDKLMNLQQKSLQQEMDNELANAKQALSGQDMIELLKALYSLNRISQQLESVDPNRTLISRSERNSLSNLVTQIQEKIKNNFSLLVTQADTQFNQSLANEDLQKSKEAIFVLRQAATLQGDQELTQKINDYFIKRVKLLVKKGEEFYQEQKAILDDGQYDNLETQRKELFLNELNSVLAGSANITPDIKNQITSLESKLRTLVKPGPLTDAYEIESVVPSGGSSYKITARDKTTNRPISVYLREGGTNKNTQITLKQVDTDNGFVILSKSGYTDIKVPISSTR